MARPPTTAGEATTPRARWCAPPSLEDVCRELAADSGLDVVVEDPGDTAAFGSGSTTAPIPEMAAWLVPAPWPAIVADSRERASLDPVIADPSFPGLDGPRGRRSDRAARRAHRHLRRSHRDPPGPVRR